MAGIFGGIRERIWGNLSWEGRKAGDLLYKEGKSLYNDHICIFGSGGDFWRNQGKNLGEFVMGRQESRGFALQGGKIPV